MNNLLKEVIISAYDKDYNWIDQLTKDEFKTEAVKKPTNAPSNITMNLNKLKTYIA
jgi:hypothetical protein